MIHLDTTFLVDLLREARRVPRLAGKAPLLTRNLDHFQRVPGLKVLSY